jgi:hypothetical protein
LSASQPARSTASDFNPQSFFEHFRNRVLTDAALTTVARLEPISEFLCALA